MLRRGTNPTVHWEHEHYNGQKASLQASSSFPLQTHPLQEMGDGRRASDTLAFNKLDKSGLVITVSKSE